MQTGGLARVLGSPAPGEEPSWAASRAGPRSLPHRALSACSLLASTRIEARHAATESWRSRGTEPAVDLDVRACLQCRYTGSQATCLLSGVRLRKAPPGFGYDFAGSVDEVGEDVGRFTVGDRVYGGVMERAAADFVVIKTDASEAIFTLSKDSATRLRARCTSPARPRQPRSQQSTSRRKTPFWSAGQQAVWESSLCSWLGLLAQR
jgi:hypothetical protein